MKKIVRQLLKTSFPCIQRIEFIKECIIFYVDPLHPFINRFLPDSLEINTEKTLNLFKDEVVGFKNNYKDGHWANFQGCDDSEDFTALEIIRNHIDSADGNFGKAENSYYVIYDDSYNFAIHVKYSDKPSVVKFPKKVNYLDDILKNLRNE